ncbi:quinolinate synthase NadA [Cyclobacteriaceae bacterium]|nr:quinolinate synthase NadA [Cyclobacteriaceae bacterium]
MKSIRITPFTDAALTEEILALKKKKHAVILAHYYQTPDIQDIADYVGDSLGLSQQAAKTDADIIVFAGVHFMAETAKILNPTKKVVLPDLAASCSLAEGCLPDDFARFLMLYPNHKVISYVNCSAEIKAMSDVICTSANAEKIVNSFPKNQPLIFAPDKNLGDYINQKTGRNMVLWDGACMVHEAFSIEKILRLQKQHPDAKFIAHPESEKHVLSVASYIGSTTEMINYAVTDPTQKFIVATEAGILHKMQQMVPDKILIPAPANEDNHCACAECAFMKMNSLEKLYLCLKDESPEITVSEEIITRALLPLQRMLEISK